MHDGVELCDQGVVVTTCETAQPGGKREEMQNGESGNIVRIGIKCHGCKVSASLSVVVMLLDMIKGPKELERERR